MEIKFCESHQRIETLIQAKGEHMAIGTVEWLTLNEDVLGEHHLSASNRAFVHAGPSQGCRLCQ